EDSGAIGVNGDQTNNAANLSGAAYHFHRSDGTWTQSAYLKAANADSLDRFGIAVAIDGETIVVSATLESSDDIGVNGDSSNNAATYAGAAYVFNLYDNVAPTDIALTRDTFHHTVATAGATLATLSGVDANANDTSTFALVSGAGDDHNAAFVIDHATLKVGAAPLPLGTYSIRLRATDSNGASIEKVVAITIHDDAPPSI